MTATVMHSFGTLAHTLQAWALKGIGKVAAVLAARRNRSAIFSLAGCDDHMLKDIGLTRSEVLGALAVGYGEDPSSRLQRPSPSHAALSVARPRLPHPLR